MSVESAVSNELDQIRFNYVIAILESNHGNKDLAIARLNEILASNQNDYLTLYLTNKLLGQLFIEQGNYDLSLKYYNELLLLEERTGNISSQINDLRNVSTIYYFKGDYDKALAYTEKCIMLAHSNNIYDFDNEFFQDLPPIFIELGEYDSAQYYLDLAFSTKSSENYDLYTHYINYGLLKDKQGEYLKASELYKKALYVSDSTQIKSDMRIALNNLAYVNYSMGNYQLAFDYLDSAVTVDAEVRDADFAKSIRDLELKYEDLEKDKNLQDLTFKTERDKSVKIWGGITAGLVIAGLSGLYFTNRKRLFNARQLAKESALRHEKEKELVALHSSLETLEMERKRTAMDLHDGIGALASSVRMRVSLVENRLETSELKDHLQIADQALIEISQDVKRIAFNMMPTSLNHLGLIAGIEEFVKRLPKDSNIEINFYSDCEELSLSESSEISIYRIAQELITNGIKYSNASEISLELMVENNELIMIYFDNGDGFDALDANNGNGMGILKTRVNYLQGTLDFNSSKELGTTYKITLPYEEVPRN